MKLQEWLDRNYTKEEQLNLTSLDCYNGGLTSLEGVEKLNNLTILDCSNNSLTSLKGIENLVNLKTLFCDNNSLTSLKGVENLVNLNYFSCDNNPLPYKSKALKGIIKEVNTEVRKEKIKKLLL